MDSERARDALACFSRSDERLSKHAGASVTTVGRNAVTPALRCAAAIAAIPSTVGLALNSTPPPPLICQSMKPALGIPPPIFICPPSRGDLRARERGSSPSITSARSSCSRRRRRCAPRETFMARLPSAAPWRRDQQERPIGWIVQRGYEHPRDPASERGRRASAHAADHRDRSAPSATTPCVSTPTARAAVRTDLRGRSNPPVEPRVPNTRGAQPPKSPGLASRAQFTLIAIGSLLKWADEDRQSARLAGADPIP